MVGLPNVREIIVKLLMKWLSIPVGILVTCMAGAALNLGTRYGNVSNHSSDLVQQCMLSSVEWGYYLGILPGLLVDKLPARMIPMVVAAVISAISFGGLAYTIDADFTSGGVQFITILLMFLAGFAASMATMCSMVTIVTNFKHKKVNVGMAGILITYMKLSPAFEDAIKQAVLPDLNMRWYLIIIGILVTVIMLIGAMTIRDADLPMILDKLSPTTDPGASFVWYISTAVFLLTYWIFVMCLFMYKAGVIVIIVFLIINFLMLFGAIFMIYSTVKSGKMPSIGLNMDKPPPDKDLTEMIMMPKYIYLCLAGMFLLGAGSSYEENLARF